MELFQVSNEKVVDFLRSTPFEGHEEKKITEEITILLLGEENPDYAERAPFIIASFVSEAGGADKLYREAHGLEEKEISDRVYVPLEEEFPLVSRLASSCTHYLASILISDENPELEGCIPVDKQLADILQQLMDKYTFAGVDNSWTKLCYYYQYFG